MWGPPRSRAGGRGLGTQGDLLFLSDPFVPLTFSQRPVISVVKIDTLALINGSNGLLAHPLKVRQRILGANPRLQPSLCDVMGSGPWEGSHPAASTQHPAPSLLTQGSFGSVWPPPWGTPTSLTAELSAPHRACPSIS